MSSWTYAAALKTIEPNKPYPLDLGGKQIVLVNLDGNFHAFSALCPHKAGPLGFGFLEGTTIYCPLHGWAFDITTGACQDFPEKPISCYPVRVVGEEIQVELP